MPEKAAKSKVEEPAAIAPVPNEDAEADRLFNEFAAKHADKYQSDAGGESLDDDKPEGGETPEPEASADGKADDPAKATPEIKAETKVASQDAPAVEDIWAKAAKDPNTAALKKAWDEAPATARPAIESAQRKLLERGQEIHRLRSERSSKPAAVQTPAPKPDEKPYDPASDSEWQDSKKEYTDALGAVEKMVEKRMASALKQIDSRLVPLTEKTEVAAKAAETVTLAEQKVLLADLVPDYTASVTSKGFREAFDPWLETQPDAVKQMAMNNNDFVRNANEVASVFTLFQAQTKFGAKAAPSPAVEPAKPETRPANPLRQQQLKGSTTVETRGPGVVANPDENDSDYWWNHWTKRKESENRVH